MLICTNTQSEVNESLTRDDSFDVSIQPFVSSAEHLPSVVIPIVVKLNSSYTFSGWGTLTSSYRLAIVVASIFSVEKTLDYYVLYTFAVGRDSDLKA